MLFTNLNIKYFLFLLLFDIIYTILQSCHVTQCELKVWSFYDTVSRGWWAAGSLKNPKHDGIDSSKFFFSSWSDWLNIRLQCTSEYHRTNNQTNWKSNWLTNKQTNILTDWLPDCLRDWLPDRLPDGLPDWRTDELTDSMTEWQTDWRTDGETDWLTDARTGRPWDGWRKVGRRTDGRSNWVSDRQIKWVCAAQTGLLANSH